MSVTPDALPGPLVMPVCGLVMLRAILGVPAADQSTLIPMTTRILAGTGQPPLAHAAISLALVVGSPDPAAAALEVGALTEYKEVYPHLVAFGKAVLANRGDGLHSRLVNLIVSGQAPKPMAAALRR